MGDAGGTGPLIRAKTLLVEAQDRLAQVVALVEQAAGATWPSTILQTPEALDRAIADALTGAFLTVSSSLVYPAPLTLRRGVKLQSDFVYDSGWLPRDAPAPRFLNGITVASDNIRLVGLEVRHARTDTDLVVVTGAHCELNQLRVLGDPVKGAKRGIAGNGADLTIIRCDVDDIFGAYPNPNNSDPHALGIWDSPGPFRILNNRLSGGAQSILIGGGDPSSDANIPSDGLIRGNLLTGNPAWQTQAVGMKTRLEFKNARRWAVEGNTIEYAWAGHGQDGYLLTLTPRNQSGNAPYSTVEDLTIGGDTAAQRNLFAHAAAAINILGSDNVHPSQRLARVAIVGNDFRDLDPLRYTATGTPGSNRMILVDRGPLDLEIRGNTFEGQHLGSVLYFAGLPPAERLDVVDNVWPISKYGIFGVNASVAKPGALVPPAWTQYVTSGTLTGNRVQ